MTLGIDVETRVNIDDIQVGQIDGGTDFSAQHLALGHIARTGGETFNGVSYNEGDAIPFEARKPYIELAEDSAGLKGFRMGFAEARGSVSSHTTSFSGALPGLKIRDDDGSVYDTALYAGAGNTETDYRATHVGVKMADPGFCADGLSCAPLTNLRSVIVGEDAGAGADTVAFTDGFFIGFQRDEMDWKSLDSANTINAGKGVFINLPVNMIVDRDVLVGAGVERLRTHVGDGLF